MAAESNRTYAVCTCLNACSCVPWFEVPTKDGDGSGERRGSLPAIEDTDDLFLDSRQNEKPISEIVDHFVTESGNA
jgi:hypothetical protein